MAWQPTEGMKRAHGVVSGLTADWRGVSTQHLDPSFCHRMTEVIARALDQALADGAAQTEPWGDFEHAGAFPNGNGHASDKIATFSRPLGTEAPLEDRMPDPVEQAEEGPGAPANPLFDPTPRPGGGVFAVDTNEVQLLPTGVIREYPISEVFTPKKKRGRPAGSKNKPKKAKGKKAPVAETVAETVPQSEVTP